MASKLATVACLLLALGAQARFNSSCGDPCKTTSQCHAGCSHCNGAYCVPACGQRCKTQADCGPPTLRPSTACPLCIKGYCQGAELFGQSNTIPSTLPPGGVPPKPGHPLEAPILPSAWNATVTYHNYTDDGRTDHGRTWYDFAYGAARFDFPAPCPFIQAANFSVNNGPCSSLFYKGHNYYVYPEAKTCCEYRFPVWTPDCFRKANATYVGTYELPLGNADIWDVSFASPWRPGYEPARISHQFPLNTGYTVQRRIFTTREGIPIGLNETLTSTVNVFNKVEVGPQEESIFTDLIQNCHNTAIKPEGVRDCMWYPSSGRLGHWGYG